MGARRQPSTRVRQQNHAACMGLSTKLWRKIERFVKKLETVVPYLVGVPKRNGKLSTETFCLTDRVQHGHAHCAHQTCCC
jgi:hypothetical protein